MDSSTEQSLDQGNDNESFVPIVTVEEEDVKQVEAPALYFINTEGVHCSVNNSCTWNEKVAPKEEGRVEWECPGCGSYLCANCMFYEKCKHGMHLCPVCPGCVTMIQQSSPSPTPAALEEEAAVQNTTSETKKKARRSKQQQA